MKFCEWRRFCTLLLLLLLWLLLLLLFLFLFTLFVGGWGWLENCHTTAQAYNIYVYMQNDGRHNEPDWAVDNVIKNVQKEDSLHSDCTRESRLLSLSFFHLCQTISICIPPNRFSSFPLTWLSDLLLFASTNFRTLTFKWVYIATNAE